MESEAFINTLMAQTSMEGNVSVNLVMMGLDNRPAQKNLKTILQEWLDYRTATVTRRLQHRLDAVKKRIHILDGRMIAFLHIDHVIRVIREADEPKPELMAAFQLTEIQAEDILEIRLRQLARLEGIKIERELNELREEAGSLKTLLGDENEKRKLIIKEIQADAKQFGDARRTLVAAAERATLTQTTADEPITLILSQQGWLRARAGHGVDTAQIAFKEGDALQQVLETRTVQPVVVWDSHGRSYTLDAAEIPKGRGDGVPIGSLIELPSQASVVALLAGATDAYYLLSGCHGYGFIAKLEDLFTRQKAGKAVLTLDEGETALPPVPIAPDWLIVPESRIVLASANKRLLAFAVSEMKIMAKGRGLQLIKLADGDTLALISAVSSEHYTLHIIGKRGAAHQETLRIADIAGKRAGKGKLLDISGSLKAIETR